MPLGLDAMSPSELSDHFTAHPDPFDLQKLLGEVRVVEILVLAGRQLQDPVYKPCIESAVRRPASASMDNPLGTL
jgi:hypothetical protein